MSHLKLAAALILFAFLQYRCSAQTPAITPPGTAGLRQLEFVSFSPQGPAALRATTGRVVRSVQLVGVVACSSKPMRGAVLWQQSIAAGYFPLVLVGSDLLKQAAGRNWWVISARAFQILTTSGVLAVSGGLITGSPRVVMGLITAHGVGDQILTWLKADAPDPTSTLSSLLDPTREYPAGCLQGQLVAAWDRKVKYQAATLPLD